MLPQHVLFALVAAVSAVPLNINLGAYSPALVVGDGENSLGSSEKASELMQTLASGAATGTGQQGQQREGQQPKAGEQRPQGEQRVAEGEKAEEAKPEEKPAEGEAAKEGRDLKTLNLRDILGKREAAPESGDRLAAVEEAMEWIKRDLAGFREALGFARDAQKDAPRVELGTGDKGAGVGVVVNAGQNVQANSAANGARPQGERPRQKRSEVVAEESETPKMTLVAITEV